MKYWSETLLEKKRILITGASSGIGRECAIACSNLGAHIILMGRDEKRLQEALHSLSGTGHSTIICDLTLVNSIKDHLAHLKSTEPISGFIHCAGIERTRPLKSFDSEDFAVMFNTNVTSAIELTRVISALGYLEKNGASYVFISSVSGINGEKGKLEYSSTKASLFALTKSLALELAVKHIRVNCISPAMVQTPMFKSITDSLPEDSVNSIEAKHLFGFIEPSDVANLCIYLISDLSRKITGSNIVIDSGYTLK
ncbi:MAG: SDR family NAD(P)-dependent oxidoreductase [Candidatus Cloacimonetes bacterium]|nr:SDR family NAD(P)-dependent oxidoreductase [Candidatus Cloacimonadota bacterium]